VGLVKVLSGCKHDPALKDLADEIAGIKNSSNLTRCGRWTGNETVRSIAGSILLVPDQMITANFNGPADVLSLAIKLVEVIDFMNSFQTPRVLFRSTQPVCSFGMENL